MITAIRQTWRSIPGFGRVVLLLAVEVVMIGWWMQSAVAASGSGLEPMDATCARLPEFGGVESTPVRGEWSWFPPGIECFADYGNGWQAFYSPSWLAVLAPTIVGLIVGVALLFATGSLLFAAALRVRGRKLVPGGALLLLSELIALLAFPVAFANAGGLAILWGPLALLVSAVLLLAGGVLLRPAARAASAEPTQPVAAAPQPVPHVESTSEAQIEQSEVD